MISALLLDFSRVLLHPKDKTYQESLNGLHAKLSKDPVYKFLDYFELNQELLQFLKNLKGKYNLSIFTSETIQEAPEIQDDLKEIFENIYSALKLGVSKQDPNAYKIIAKQLQKEENQILFIDDSLINLEAAKGAGLKTLHYTSNQDLFSKLNQLLGGR